MSEANLVPVFDQVSLAEFLTPESEEFIEANAAEVAASTLQNRNDLASLERYQAARHERNSQKKALENKLGELSLANKKIHVVTAKWSPLLGPPENQPLLDAEGVITHADIDPWGKVRLGVTRPGKVFSRKAMRNINVWVDDRAEFIITPTPDAFLEMLMSERVGQ